ncbi:MAG: tail fiber domain-containing protein, partial [Bacteroidetes bacterium]|nr:tail fiber domain-containing protein [Bacteroidota bacterium]
TAMGNNTIASGHSSTAMGMQTQATGNYSTAMGYTSRATNTYATAMGYNTLASGSNATTMGIQTEAAGYGSFAIGRGIKVSGMYSAGIAIADMTGTEVVDPNTLAIMGGEVGIGIVSPTCALDVNGKSKTTNFQMTNGASSGYILQSDASGNASWVSNGDNSSSNEIQNLSQVLAQGNSAGSYSINLNTNGITNVNNASFRATDGDMGNLTYTVDDRWELSNGGFYIMNTCPTTWIYSDNIYLGNADSDIIHTRDNQFRTRYIRAYSANGINFQTDDGLDRLFLADNGNFGVGTTSPAEKLHINGSLRGNQSGAVRISTGYGYVDIGPENTGWSHFVTDRPSFYFSSPIYIDGGRLSSYSTNHLYLQTDGTTRLFINNTSGNVGIGTTSPAYTFDVSGTARISSTADPGLILGSGTSSYLQFGDSNVKMYRAANDRITIRVESTDNAAQFASYGLYLPQAVGTALYVTGGARINYNDSGDEVFITDADGYIGNGVTTPAAPLHIANTAWLPWGGWNNMIQLENNSHAGITYKDGDDNNGILMGFHGVDDAIYFGWISNWSSGTGNYMMKLSSNGNLHAYGNITATGTCCSSDLCWKRNIQPIDNALGKVLKMRGVTFEWKRDDESGQNFREGKNIGVIAQEVEKVFPELVETSDEGKKYVYYQNITAVLIEAMKEQQKQIEQLQEKVETGDKVLLEKSQEIDELKEEISKVKELLQSSSKK